MYVYRHFRDAGCYTVGFFLPSGEWEPESDFNTADEAAARVRWLNSGAPEPTPEDEEYEDFRQRGGQLSRSDWRFKTRMLSDLTHRPADQLNQRGIDTMNRLERELMI